MPHVPPNHPGCEATATPCSHQLFCDLRQHLGHPGRLRFAVERQACVPKFNVPAPHAAHEPLRATMGPCNHLYLVGLPGDLEYLMVLVIVGFDL